MPENRRVYYTNAAVVGAILWGILGTLCGDALLGQFLTWDKLTPTQVLAEIGFYVLTTPTLIIEPMLPEARMMTPVGRIAFLCLCYGINGCVWGLAAAMLYRWVRKER